MQNYFYLQQRRDTSDDNFPCIDKQELNVCRNVSIEETGHDKLDEDQEEESILLSPHHALPLIRISPAPMRQLLLRISENNNNNSKTQSIVGGKLEGDEDESQVFPRMPLHFQASNIRSSETDDLGLNSCLHFDLVDTPLGDIPLFYTDDNVSPLMLNLKSSNSEIFERAGEHTGVWSVDTELFEESLSAAAPFYNTSINNGCKKDSSTSLLQKKYEELIKRHNDLLSRQDHYLYNERTCFDCTSILKNCIILSASLVVDDCFSIQEGVANIIRIEAVVPNVAFRLSPAASIISASIREDYEELFCRGLDAGVLVKSEDGFSVVPIELQGYNHPSFDKRLVGVWVSPSPILNFNRVSDSDDKRILHPVVYAMCVWYQKLAMKYVCTRSAPTSFILAVGRGGDSMWVYSVSSSNWKPIICEDDCILFDYEVELDLQSSGEDRIYGKFRETVQQERCAAFASAQSICCDSRMPISIASLAVCESDILDNNGPRTCISNDKQIETSTANLQSPNDEGSHMCCKDQAHIDTTKGWNETGVICSRAHEIICKQKKEIAALYNRVNELTSALAELSIRKLEESKSLSADYSFQGQQNTIADEDIQEYGKSNDGASLPSNSSILSPITAPTFFSPEKHAVRSKRMDKKVRVHGNRNAFEYGCVEPDNSSESSFEGEMMLSVQTATTFKPKPVFTIPKSIHDRKMVANATLPKICYSISHCDSDSDDLPCEEGPSMIRLEVCHDSFSGDRYFA